MPKPTPITMPGGFAPAYAVGFAHESETLALVSDESRLPVATAASPSAPISGTTSTSLLAGPLAAVAGRIVSVELSGAWQGSATLLRSTDGGTTKVPLRVAGEPWAIFTSSGLEQAWLESEDGASFYLDIELQSGTLAYRVSQ